MNDLFFSKSLNKSGLLIPLILVPVSVFIFQEPIAHLIESLAVLITDKEFLSNLNWKAFR